MTPNKKLSWKSKRRLILIFFGVFLAIVILYIIIPSFKDNSSCNEKVCQPPNHFSNEDKQQIISGEFDFAKIKTDTEWKELLTKDQYTILRERGTEVPFTGELNNEKRKGAYYSHGCNEPLFRSEQKFDSGTGWPSFTAPISEDAIVLRKESGLDNRVEVLDICGGHLGHVFDDGPVPTGKRYCINSDALYFVPD